jgi:Mlc titration factor MtfA (ptsG expression regulator)
VIFNWLKRRRRKKIVEQPFPPEWLEWLAQRVPHYRRLNDADQEKLRKLVQVFVAEKIWEGCKGLTVTDEMKATIAGQACLLLLGIEHDYFRNVKTILVFPRQFVPRENQDMDESGVIHESNEAALGQAWENGPVILSWADSKAGGRNHQDGLNVVLHEFAHKLDLRDGMVNGTPPLQDRQQYTRWAEVMRREYEQLVENSRKRRATLLDDYGATDPGEFFAVAVECFFEKAIQMRQKHRELYETLSDYFRQDPAARSTRERD